MSANLLPLIEDYLAKTGISAFRFGLLAAQKDRLVERLRNGRRIWPETEMKARAYILAQQNGSIPAPRPRGKRAQS